MYPSNWVTKNEQKQTKVKPFDGAVVITLIYLPPKLGGREYGASAPVPSGLLIPYGCTCTLTYKTTQIQKHIKDATHARYPILKCGVRENEEQY